MYSSLQWFYRRIILYTSVTNNIISLLACPTVWAKFQEKHLLVAVVFQVLLVAVVLKHMLRVMLSKPLSLVDVKRARLSLHFLTLPAPRDWGRQAWETKEEDKSMVLYKKCSDILKSSFKAYKVPLLLTVYVSFRSSDLPRWFWSSLVRPSSEGAIRSHMKLLILSSPR